MKTRFWVFSVLLTLASIAPVQADSFFYNRAPSVGLSFGHNGFGLAVNHHSGRKFYSENRFNGRGFNRRINRGYRGGYRGQRFQGSRIHQGNYNKGRRDLSDDRLGDYRRYPNY